MFKFAVYLRSFTRKLSFGEMNGENCVVAVCQFTATNNKEQNLSTVKKLVAQAVAQDAKVVFLPEGCDYVGTNKDETKALSEMLSGYLMNEYKKLAANNNIWLSVGGFHEFFETNCAEKKFSNSHVLINGVGEISAIYRKLHLFDVTIPEKNIFLKESEMVSAGSEIVKPVQTPAGSLGLSICYDLRFPELSVILRKQGSTILTFPSAFTSTTGQAHWEVLLRARAIENQCYVIAAAQFGKHNPNRISHGQSMIIDPWGKIIAECPSYSGCNKETDESVAVATINPRLIEKVREEMPVFKHRRNDIYSLQEHSSVTISPHVLVSTLRFAPRLEDLRPEEVADLFLTVVRVQKGVEKAYSAKATTICVQDGKSAGQTVPHVHVHVLPRREGDFENNDEIYERLANHDRDNAQKIRSVEEMSSEADMLRKYFEQTSTYS